jgi:hypothetical protein
LARRRSEAGGVILLLVAMVIAAVACVGPFFIAIWAIVAELRAREFRSAGRASQLISEDERLELGRWETQLSQIDQRIGIIHHHGSAQGLARRTDGWFDERNGDGRRLNQQLQILFDERGRVAQSAELLKNKLARRMENWLTAHTSVIGTRVGLLVFVSIFAAMTVNRLNANGADWTLPTLMFGSGSDGSDRLVASAVATAAAVLTLWMAKLMARASLS